MGTCCNKRDTNITIANTKRSSMSTRRSSILFEKFSKQSNYKEKYEYISILGNGGFGKVRLFRNKITDMKYAIKTLKKDFFNSHGIESMIREVAILREVDHPNIIKYFETYEDEYYLHIVMEYIPGDNLFKMITSKKNSNFGEKDAAEIIEILLKTVLFLHNKNILHRDIKPENILFSLEDNNESLKLIDFGLSIIGTKKDNYRVGSPYYMSPEMIDGESFHETDIWSIGVILYVMMTGIQPFQGRNNSEVFEKIKIGKYDSKLLEKHQCSEELRDFIKKILVRDRRRRISIEAALEHKWLKLQKTVDTQEAINDVLMESLRNFARATLFQKEILFYIAKISSEQELQQLKQAFTKIDKDNSGEIEYGEIRGIFESIGIQPTKEDVDTLWTNLDFHKDAKINYSEFLAATISSVDFQKEEKLWSAFKYFDTTDSGYVTYDSVILALKSSNVKVSEDELTKEFQQLGKKNNKLTFEEFKSIFLSRGKF